MKQGMKEFYEEGVAHHSARVLRNAPSGSLRSVNRGIGGLGIELRKIAIGTPTFLQYAEGYTGRGDKCESRLGPA